MVSMGKTLLKSAEFPLTRAVDLVLIWKIYLHTLQVVVRIN